MRQRNQVNALVKIISDFSVSAITYFFIGFYIAYQADFFAGASVLSETSGYALVKFFFLLNFAADTPAIVSGGIAERARFYPQLFSTFVLVAMVYPFFEGLVSNGMYGVQDWI